MSSVQMSRISMCLKDHLRNLLVGLKSFQKLFLAARPKFMRLNESLKQLCMAEMFNLYSESKSAATLYYEELVSHAA